MQNVYHFENAEQDYLNWLENNRTGYVLNLGRPPNKSYLMLHRATCGDIRNSSPKRGVAQFTGGKYAKLCALEHKSITTWVNTNVRGGLSFTHLCKRCRPDAPVDEAAKLRRVFASSMRKAQRDSIAVRRERLEQADKKPKVRFVMTRVFDRNPYVVAEVLDRAKGRCEKCNAPAPFNGRKSGLPYLEVHHRIPLSENGDDTVDNAVAVCPNCHRYLHFG